MARNPQKVLQGFGNITNTTIRGMPPAYFMEEMDTLPDGLRSLADQARNGTLPKAPSPEGDSAYEQALDFGASPDQALEAAMAAAQDMAVRQLQREAVAKAKAQASNAAAMAAITHSDEALFGGALEDIDGGYARALASSFGVSPDALKESVASVTQEASPAPSLKANIGLPDYLRGGPPQTPMTPGPNILDEIIYRQRDIPTFENRNTLPPPARTFQPATLANTYSQFETEVTDDEVILGAAPKKIQELYPDALDTKDGDDEDDPYARTWAELRRLEKEKEKEKERLEKEKAAAAGGDDDDDDEDEVAKEVERFRIVAEKQAADETAEGYLAGEGVFSRSLTGVHGLPFDQQYGMAAQRSLGSRWYNPRVQKYISAQMDAVYGRFVLQKLMASFNGKKYSPTFADLEAGSRGTEGQELYVDWLARGYTQGREEFYEPDTMRSSWNNLVRASDPGTYTHAKDDLLGYRYAVVAANERQQISAAKAMANITGYGPMGAIKEQGFQRLLDRFYQAKEFGGEKRGLAAWLGDIKGSVWDPLGEVHGTSQVVSTKV
tara:strand:- start:497 stop:2152 length:1656 start_codon:yes stop_codon:yes gene_type:complete